MKRILFQKIYRLSRSGFNHL